MISQCGVDTHAKKVTCEREGKRIFKSTKKTGCVDKK